jgi:Spx/MgsR family transcriptional regulator
LNTLFGIPNCDSIKKARKWFASNNIEYQFHDYRKDGIDINWLADTEERLGWEAILNKRGTTYRQLPDEQKSSMDKEKALMLMLEQPAMIKRPILVSENEYLVGFKIDEYTKVLL